MERKDSMNEKVEYQYYASVESKQLEWLWYPYIPYGKITLLQGDPGDGKSTFALNLAALMTTGGVLPDGRKIEKSIDVIYQCPEDGSSDTIKPRLLRAGADCSRVAYIMEKDEKLTLDDKRFEEVLSKTGAKFLILDPVQSFISQDGDMQSATKMRSAMRSLGNIAEKYGCAILLIGHMNKASGGKKIYRGLGSIDIAAAARSVLMISRDEDSPEIRYMFPIKSSLAPEGCAISFLMNPERGFQWIGKCSINTNDLKAQVNKRKSNKKEMAKDLLKVLLSEEDAPAKMILDKMETLGVGNRTVRTAQKELGIESYKKDSIWHWRLPDEVTDEAMDIDEEQDE